MAGSVAEGRAEGNLREPPTAAGGGVFQHGRGTPLDESEYDLEDDDDLEDEDAEDSEEDEEVIHVNVHEEPKDEAPRRRTWG